MTDPTTVACSDCMAPAGVDCYTQADTHTVHASRVTDAELHALTLGSCALCGRPMVYGTVSGVTDAWHPDPDDAAACPLIPDPHTDPAGWAMAVNLGARPGYPGVEHFLPTAVVGSL